MNNEERITMLREMPIPQLLIKMGLPTMIGMLVTGLYSIVDACFVGGLGTQQMGAISVVFPVGQILSGLGAGRNDGTAQRRHKAQLGADIRGRSGICARRPVC